VRFDNIDPKEGKPELDERRHAPRVEPRRPLHAKVKASVPVRIVDISAGGAQIELATALRPHVSCEMRVTLDNSEVIISSTVRRCRAWGFGYDEADRKVLLYRAGVEFGAMPAALIERLKAEYLEHAGLDLEVGSTREAGRSTAKEPASEPVPTASAEPPSTQASAQTSRRAPRRDGPVKIRINADTVRGILDRKDK
jgi:PilZ domain